MRSFVRSVRRSVRELDPGTKDRLLVWGAAAASVTGSAAAWLVA